MKIADIKVDYVNHCGDDLSTVDAARVSFDKQSEWATYGCNDCQNSVQYACQDNCACVAAGAKMHETLKEGDVKLINYLAKHKHKSPFNHSFVSVRVKAPVFVCRQLVKHKFMPINEVSRRYVDSEPEFYMPDVWRGKADNVKQGSLVTRAEAMYEGEQQSWGNPDGVFYVKNAVQGALATYNMMLEKGVCAEQARMVLPQNMMTTFLWSGTLGAFADMLVLRLSPYTQAETRIVAEQIRDIVQPLFPVSLKALLENA